MGNKAGRKGFTTSGGGGTRVGHHASNSGFGPFPARGVTSILVDTTMTEGGHAGVVIMSGSTGTGLVTGTMPTADAAVGGTYIVRATSADAHVLTGSQEASGVLAFSMSGSQAVQAGSKLELGGSIGDSVVLQSDGVHFIVIGNHGDITISGD